MDSALDFANLFIETDAGELLYFLIAVGLTLSGLLVALDQRTRSQYEVAAARYTAALIGVVLAWGALTLGNLFTLLDSSADARIILPPLERAVIAVAILWLTWAFLTAESESSEAASRVVVLLLTLLMVAGYAFTVLTWREAAADHEFNRHSLGLAWIVIPILFSAFGMFLLFTRYRFAADIPLKLIFFGLVLAGHLYTLYQMGTDRLSGDVVGMLRLSTLAAFSLLPIVLYRVVIERFRETVGEVSGLLPPAYPAEIAPIPSPPAVPAPPSPAVAAQREAVNLLKILGIMLEKSSPRDIPMQIVKAVAMTFKADVVALAAIDNPNWADPIAAYNYIREAPVPGLALNLDHQPTMASAIELNIQCVLLPTRSSEELVDLFQRFDVRDTGPSGPAYFQPLSRDKKVVGMLILALPYSTRLLSDDERNLLEALGPIAARLLLLSREALISEVNLDGLDTRPVATPDTAAAIRGEMQAELEKRQHQVEELNAQIAELRALLAEERDKLSQLAAAGSSDMSVTQKINVLAEERQKLNSERQELVKALREARTLLVTATADRDDALYRQMVEALNQEKQNLLAEKQRLERELSNLRGAPPDRERLVDVVNTLMAEKERIEEEHNKLKADIKDAQAQLAELGLEGGVLGYAQLLAHLTEERNRFLNESKRLMAERDMLLRERHTYSQHREREQERTAQIAALQTELARLAADRETIIKQRDALKVERDALNAQRDEWLAARVRLTEQYETMRQQMAKTQIQLENLRKGAPAPSDDQAMAALKKRVAEVEEDRSNLEFELIRAHDKIQSLLTEMERMKAMPHGAADDLKTAETVVGLAQELRTPLTSIIGYSELLLSESTGILGETQRQFLNRIQVNTEQLMQLIEDLIRVLALDYGKLLLAPRKVNVEDLIDDAITASSAQYRAKGLTLHLEVEPDLPPLMGDKDALQQILTRLLTNAYLASPPDDAVRVEAKLITERASPEDNTLRDVIYFAITDQGGGIPEEDHERVFTRHYRAENPLIQGLGDKGAGLSIAKALVLAHGGRIWLETAPNVSTTFKVTIPVDHTFGDKEVMRGNVSRLIEALGE